MHLIWCTFSTASLGTTSVWPGTYVYTIVNTRSIRTPVTILNVAGICTCGNLSRKAMTFSSSYTICTKPQVRVSLTCSSWLKTWYPLLFTFDSKGLQQWAATAHSTQLEAMNERSLTCSAKLPGFLVMSIVNSDSAMLRYSSWIFFKFWFVRSFVLTLFIFKAPKIICWPGPLPKG